MSHRLALRILALSCLAAFGCGGGGGSSDPDAGPPPVEDADDDRISDELEGRADNVDTDSDGTPDYQDDDSDNDGILDLHEGSDDIDSDGLANFRDLDADNDCRSDSLEAGDEDLQTPPIDTDGDAKTNHLDLDSDDDGLSDESEDVGCDGMVAPADPVDCVDTPDTVVTGIETSAVDADTDGDGVTDLIEVAARTNPQDMACNPQSRGDFVFVVPYQEPTTPERDDLDFSTNIKALDVYLLLDRTGSVADVLNEIRSGLTNVFQGLTCDPNQTGEQICIPDLWIGMATTGYADSNGQPFTHLFDVAEGGMRSMEIAALESRLFNPPSCTECLDTAKLALWSAATGLGSVDSAECGPRIVNPYPSVASCDASPAGAMGRGYPCFRPEALPVIVYVTDESFGSAEVLNCPADTQEIVNAANAIGAKIVGIAGTSNSLTEARTLATATGAVDITANNAPIAYSFDRANPASGVQQLDRGLRALANGLPLDVSAITTDDPTDNVDAAAAFIERLEIQQAGKDECINELIAKDTDGDGILDLYESVQPGTPVCWSVVPKMNNTVQPTAQPQIFLATINVYSVSANPEDAENPNRVSLDSRNVYFLVPPKIEFSVD